MGRNKENETKGYFSYGAKGVVEEESHHKGVSYKTSRKLIESVVAKKELQTNFLTEIYGKDKDIAITNTSTSYVDTKGKPVNLTPFQLKLVTAFAQVIDTQLENENVQKYINDLPSQIEDRDQGNGTNVRLPNPVKAVLDIPTLTKLIYSKNRVGGKQTDKVREEITKLSQVKQMFSYKDSRGGTLTIKAPIITLGRELTFQTREGVVKLNKVEVTFEDVFVYEINTPGKWTLAPITLLQLWNDTGVQTELFTMLLFLLQGIHGTYVKAAQNAARAKRIELKKEKVEESEVKAEVEKLKREKLTYKESIASLLERVDSNRYQDKGKYTRLDKVKADLQQAKEALIQMGIISDYYEAKGTSGNVICCFVFNDKWLAEEGAKIKALLPPGEELKDSQEMEEIEECEKCVPFAEKCVPFAE